MFQMHVIGAQLICLTGLFLSMLLVFILPYWWVSRKPESFDGSRYEIVISLANCLSGGVFIATFFVGLMPEVRDMFLEVLEYYKVTSKFPVTEFVIFIGFLLALGIEQCVLEYKERNSGTYTSVPLTNCEENKPDLNSSPISLKDVCDSTPVDYDADNATMVKVSLSRSDSAPNHHGHSHDIGQILHGDNGIRLGLLMVSLGIHSLFEGLALGLQTSVSTLLNLVIGVSVHELLVGFAMGVNVARLRLPKSSTLKLAFLFAALIPIGQILGVLIGYYQSSSAVAVSAVLQGLAAGTFIHVTFLEVIPAEFNVPGPRILKVFFLGLGFMLLLFCSVVMQDASHHHHHH